MKVKTIFGAFSVALAASCATANTTPDYKVNVNLTEDEDGLMIYMTNFDTGVKIDSAIVENGAASFAGNIDTPVYARLIMEGSRIGDFFLEPGTVTVAPATRKIESDGKLQSEMDAIGKKLGELAKQYRSLPNDSTAAAKAMEIQTRYEALLDSAFTANASNALGYYLFLNNAQGMDLNQLDSELAKYPQFKDSRRINKLRENLLVKEATSPGHKYVDFTISQPDGTEKKLSDFVGNGHYTLVDFWASWCGPCIRETKVLKQLYEKYNGKGLEIVGVAVWDEPANTLKAIEQHQLPWNHIIDAQTVPTDLYGIQGIPCIILIDPEGNIVSRDKQDQALIDDVDAAMAAFNESKAE